MATAKKELKKIVIISKEKRDKIKAEVTQLFTDTNQEGFAEAVLYCVESVLEDIFMSGKKHDTIPPTPETPVKTDVAEVK